MSNQAWRVDEPEQQPPSFALPSPALVTTHFLLTALRRRWRVWVSAACVGMLLGLGWALASPPKPVGTVSLILAHEPSADPQQALSTDVSLLRTRTLAVDVIEELGLQVRPEEFQASVVSVPESTDVLLLEVSGPDQKAAVARARALADAYLEFRASQLGSQLEALNRGYRERIVSLREQARDLSRQYDEASTAGSGDDLRASALLNRQAQVAIEIESAEQSIEDASMKANAITDASYVLDSASPKPAPSPVKTIGLAMVSGLIGGITVGVGFVLVAALTSNRLRLREEVALALGTPVRISVGGRPHGPWWPLGRRLPVSELGMMVDALDREVSRPPKPWTGTGHERPRDARGQFAPTRLALATVDTAGAGHLVVADLAARLGAEGLDVFVVDLSDSGGLEAAVDSSLGDQEDTASRRRPVVYRPDRVPSLERGPLDPPTTSTTDSPGPWSEWWSQADVVVTLAEVDPAVGVEHLRSWVDEVVVLVAAGRSSAERLRTTGELIRSADLRLLFAMMVGTDRTDESLGLPETTYRGRSSNGRRSP